MDETEGDSAEQVWMEGDMLLWFTLNLVLHANATAEQVIARTRNEE